MDMRAAVSLLLLTAIQLVSCRKLRYRFSEDFKPIPPCPPSSRTAEGSELLLLTRNGSGCVRQNDENSAIAAGYLHGGKTYVFIHDRRGNARENWIAYGQNSLAVLKLDNYNAFAFGWDARVSRLPFASANKFSRISVAITDLQNFLSWLQLSSLKVNASNLHLIGLGYGAIIAGMAARTIRLSGGHTVGRITGLDPPMNIEKPEFQLQQDYAAFVDVIHTTGGDTAGQPLIAHAEFFTNGAKNHPAIAASSYHEYAAYLFVKSFTSYSPYWAKPCESYKKFKRGGCGVCTDDCVQMGNWIRGMNSDNLEDVRGRYYTATYLFTPSETRLVLVNMTVSAAFSGIFSADIVADGMRWKLTEKWQRLNRPFTTVLLINRCPSDSSYELRILPVSTQLPYLYQSRLSNFKFEMVPMYPGFERWTSVD